jgi:hypothetical protein
LGGLYGGVKKMTGVVDVFIRLAQSNHSYGLVKKLEKNS